MTPTDIEVVIQLDMLAFAAHLRQTGYNGPVHPRTHENVLACLNLSQTGCFVAEADKLIGYIFTHIWGTTGWIGTFGVHPDCQGQGIGQSLLGAAVEHLQGAGCMTIGLETMSDSPYNVGFYSRFGLALLIGWPQSWAFVVVRTTPKREGAAETVADVEALVIHPEAGRSLEKALQTVETFAHNQGLEHVNLAVNAADGEALQQALGYGFRVRDVMLRMVFNGEYAHPVGKVLSKWLM
jgi:GNAT superfamily N-acetyltransferase